MDDSKNTENSPVSGIKLKKKQEKNAATEYKLAPEVVKRISVMFNRHFFFCSPQCSFDRAVLDDIILHKFGFTHTHTYVSVYMYTSRVSFKQQILMA